MEEENKLSNFPKLLTNSGKLREIKKAYFVLIIIFIHLLLLPFIRLRSDGPKDPNFITVKFGGGDYHTLIFGFQMFQYGGWIGIIFLMVSLFFLNKLKTKISSLSGFIGCGLIGLNMLGFFLIYSNPSLYQLMENFFITLLFLLTFFIFNFYLLKYWNVDFTHFRKQTKLKSKVEPQVRYHELISKRREITGIMGSMITTLVMALLLNLFFFGIYPFIIVLMITVIVLPIITISFLTTMLIFYILLSRVKPSLKPLICSQCGSRNYKKQKFCTSCGRELGKITDKQKEPFFNTLNKAIKPLFYFFYPITWFINIIFGIFFINFPLINELQEILSPIFTTIGWIFIIFGCVLLILDIITLILWYRFKHKIKSDIKAQKVLVINLLINFISLLFAIALFIVVFVWYQIQLSSFRKSSSS